MNAIFATLKTVTGARILFRADSAFCTFAAIPVARWTAIKYTHAVYDEDITGRLIVRRIPELNKNKDTGQATLFDHAFAQPSPTPT